MKFRGRPSAMPEPPVRSGASASAAPIATRSASAMASTMTRRSPLAAGGGERRADGGGARRRRRPGDQADRLLGLASEPAADVGVGHRVQRMVLRPDFVEQPVVDEEVALIDGAADRRKGRAGDDASRRRAPSASASPTGPILPSGVESKVEQYLKTICRQPCRRSQSSAASDCATASAAAIERLFSATTPASMSSPARCRRQAEELRRPEAALPRQSLGQGVRNIARAGKIVRDNAEKHVKVSEAERQPARGG